jgi:hypothetical protein
MFSRSTGCRQRSAEQCVHDDLNGAADVPFSDGLRFRQRFWRAPPQVPIAALERGGQGRPYAVPAEVKTLAESSVATHVYEATGVVSGARLATVCARPTAFQSSSVSTPEQPNPSTCRRAPAGTASAIRNRMEIGAPDPDERHTSRVDRPTVDIYRSRTAGTRDHTREHGPGRVRQSVDPVRFTRGSEAMDARDGTQQGGEHAANQ